MCKRVIEVWPAAQLERVGFRNCAISHKLTQAHTISHTRPRLQQRRYSSFSRSFLPLARVALYLKDNFISGHLFGEGKLAITLRIRIAAKIKQHRRLRLHRSRRWVTRASNRNGKEVWKAQEAGRAKIMWFSNTARCARIVYQVPA